MTDKATESHPSNTPGALGSNEGLGPNARTVADHIEQRLRTWRQQQMNRSGDRLALDDFMGEDSIADLVDFVCDEYALDALLHAAPAPKADCGEAGHDEGRCGNAACLGA